MFELEDFGPGGEVSSGFGGEGSAGGGMTGRKRRPVSAVGPAAAAETRSFGPDRLTRWP